MSEISVVVPSFGHATIHRAARCVLFSRQTYRIKKLLVIDDGSSDASVEVIEKTLADAPFDAELIARENRGLCATLNEGLSKTAGDLFAYLGSDDVWLPEFLEKQVRLLTAREHGGARVFARICH